MKIKSIILLCILALLRIDTVHATPVPTLSIKEVLQITQKNSSSIRASRYHEVVAQRAINVAQSNYFPTFDFQAIDSQGFPGSSNLAGVNGLMNSPFRKGYGYGVVAKEVLLDFGRTPGAVNTSKIKAQLSRDDTLVTAYQVKTFALETYYDCSFYRSQRDTWKNLKKESVYLMNQTNHFVNTGQVSIEDRYLTASQTQQAQTAIVFFNERMLQSLDELAIIMGIPKHSFNCPALPSQAKSPLAKGDLYQSPLMVDARTQIEVAKAQLKEERANYMPQIIGVASLGDVEKARLVQKQSYAVGIGLDLPLFNFTTIDKVRQDEAEVVFKEQDLAAQSIKVQEAETKFDIVGQSARVQLQSLYQELSIANEGYAVSKKRYLSLQGTLVDLQEAYVNLARAQSDVNQAKRDILEANGSKALLNGTMY